MVPPEEYGPRYGVMVRFDSGALLAVLTSNLHLLEDE